MADVNWGLITPQNQAVDFQTALHSGAVDDALRQKSQLEKLKQTQDALDKVAAQARYDRAGDLAQRGDNAAMTAELIRTGDEKLLTAASGATKNVFDQTSQGVKSLAGSLQMMLEHIPDPETRRAIILAQKPAAIAAGIHPENVDAIAANPSDDMLRYSIGLAVTPQDQWKAHTEQQNADSTTSNAETSRMTAENPVVVGQSLVTRGGQELFRAPDYINAAPGNNVIEVGGTTANGYTSQSSIKPGSVTAEQLYRAAIEPQESGGRAGAIGPQTKYGRAQGASQMLPATAQSMAQKLGIAWQPELMTAKSAEGLAYQRKLGIAYTQAALDANGGDPRKAAEFYHGGPDTSIHGPKTRAYGDQVMSRLDRAIGQQSTTRSTRVIQQGATADAGTNGSATTGKAYLDTLPADQRAMIVAISEGRAAAPNPRTKLGQQLLQEVAAYDPTFDAANASTRVATRKSYTSGAMSNNRTALNTAMGHILHLDEQAKSLGNFETAPGILNPTYNAVRGAMGNKDLPAFEQTKQAAASEMRKVFAGTGGGSLTELEAWEKQLSSSQSYDQLHAVIGNGVKLMASRLDAQRQQYAIGMGRSDNVPRFVTDDNLRNIKARFGVQLNDGPSVGQPQQQQQSSGGRKPPPVGFTTSRNGKTYTWTGKTWEAR